MGGGKGPAPVTGSQSVSLCRNAEGGTQIPMKIIFMITRISAGGVGGAGAS